MAWSHHPRAGFRFSISDAIAILVCFFATGFAWPWIDNMALLFPWVLGHFFLFCNVFRIRRSYELFWAACFLVNFAWQMTAAIGVNWLPVILIQTPITIVLIILEMRGDRYHGVGHKWINKHVATNGNHTRNTDEAQ